VRVDEAGEDKMPAGVELLDRLARDGPERSRDAGDGVAGDGDVDDGGLMPVRARRIAWPPRTISVVPAGTGSVDMAGHLSGMRSSRGGRKRSS